MRKVLSLLLVTLMCQQLMAVSALPVRKTLTTTDGRQVTVTLMGDERFSYFVDDAGKKFKWAPAGRVQEMTIYDEMTMESTHQSRSKSDNNRRHASRQSAGYTGSKKGLVILANFSDLKFTVGTNEIYQDFFNKEGYAEYGNKGSVHDYFSDQSYGLFDLTFDVVGPVDLPQKMAYYGEHEGNSNDKNAKQFAIDAIKAAAPQIDFSKYDWDGDGVVDQVFIIYAGYGEAQGGPKESIWPHEWSIQEYNLSYNGVKLATYGCACEFKGGEGAELDCIGTACHEFSHCLGLPDSYDTSKDGDSFGMGNWDVMASGNYLGGSGAPMGYTSYERWLSGWLTPKEITHETVVTDMEALEDAPEAYVLYNDAEHNEFYILENRQPQKWGVNIRAHGLMVMHVDYDEDVWWYNQVNAAPDRQRLTFIPADNRMTKSTYDGDPYPGKSGNHSLTDKSVPAAYVYNENFDGTYFMGKPIEDIQETKSGLISFLAMKGIVSGPENLSSEMISDASFKLNWEEVPGAQAYEVDIVSRLAPKTNPFEAILLEEDFATSCYADKVSGLKNVANKLDDYTTTKGWTGKNLYCGPKGLQIGHLATGSLKSPDVAVSSYGLTTACIKAAPATEGETVPASVYLYIDGETYGAWSVTFDKETSFILEGARKAESTVAYEIVPDKKLSISYFSVHDGAFTEKDFDDHKPQSLPGVDIKCSMLNISRPAMANGDEPLVVNTNSLVYDKVEPGYLYICKVRAILGEDKYSRWSDEIEVNPTATAIDAIKAEHSAPSPAYDLMGRRVTDSYNGIVIRNGKKYIQ